VDIKEAGVTHVTKKREIEVLVSRACVGGREKKVEEAGEEGGAGESMESVANVCKTSCLR
jgi:hypothetical protein